MDTNFQGNGNGCGVGTAIGAPATTVVQRQITGVQPQYGGPYQGYQGPYQPPQYSGGPYGYQGYQPQTVQPATPRPLIPPEKHHFETKIKVINGLPRVLVTREAYWDMCCIVAESGSNEVGWLGTVRVVGNDYVIEKIFLPKQKVHGATCEITPEGISELSTQLLSQENGMEICNSIRFWGHVHPGNSTSPSGQDDDQMKVFADSCQDFFVRGILGKEGRMEFTIFIYEKNLVFLDAPWAIREDEEELTARRKAWHDQVSTNVGSFTYTQTTYTNVGSHTTSATSATPDIVMVDDEASVSSKSDGFRKVMNTAIYRRAAEICRWMGGQTPGISPFYIADDILQLRVKEPHCSREFQQEWAARGRFIYLSRSHENNDPDLDKAVFQAFCELYQEMQLLQKRAFEVANEPQSEARRMHVMEVLVQLTNLLKEDHASFLRVAADQGHLPKELVEAVLNTKEFASQPPEAGSESDGE